MRMLLLAGQDQAATVEERSPEALIVHWEGCKRDSGDISLEAELEARLQQIRGENMRWAYDRGVDRLGKTNGPSLARLLEGGATPSMWWTSLIYERHPKLSPWLYPVYKLRCLELLLEEKDISVLELRGGDKLLKKTLSELCRSLGMAFSASAASRAKSGDSLSRKIYNFFPAPVRAIARYVFWLWSVRRILTPCPVSRTAAPAMDRKEADALVVSYFPNIDLKAAARGRYRSRYWEDLHDLLNKEAVRENPDGPHFVHWLFIRFPSPELNLRQCLKLCRDFTREGKDGASFQYLEQFLSFGDLCQSLWRWLKLCASSLGQQRAFARKCSFHNSRLNFWPYLKAQWAESMRGWRCLERCLQNAAFRSYFKAAGKRRWVLFPLENCPWERMLTEAARAGADKIPVYGVQHSIVRPTDFRYFDDPRSFSEPDCAIFQPDIIGANGGSALEQWLKNGMPKARAKELEALRYQYLLEESPPVEKAVSTLPPEPGEPLELSGRRLLVLTSFFEDETRAHLKLLQETLEAGLLEKWRVIIKPHPYLAVEAWREALPRHLGEQVEIIGTPLSLALTEGGLVWTSNSTTAALEAALKSLPLMVMSPSGDFDLCPIQNIPGLARTGSLADVKKWLGVMPVAHLPEGYLNLGPGLEQWRKLLHFSPEKKDPAFEGKLNSA